VPFYSTLRVQCYIVSCSLFDFTLRKWWSSDLNNICVVSCLVYLTTPFQLHILYSVEWQDDCERWNGKDARRGSSGRFQVAFMAFVRRNCKIAENWIAVFRAEHRHLSLLDTNQEFYHCFVMTEEVTVTQ